MFSKKHLSIARSLGVATLVAMGLASCATYDDDFVRINSRLDQLDTRVEDAAQNAAAANQAAQQANARLDSLESRVQRLETSTGRVPRG
jgi:murein lipoprotein